MERKKSAFYWVTVQMSITAVAGPDLSQKWGTPGLYAGRDPHT